MRIRFLSPLLATLLLLGGCIDAKLNVRLNPDGSGERKVEFHWDSRALDAAGLEIEDVRELCDLREIDGWKLTRAERQEGAESFEEFVLSRTLQIPSLEAWGKATRDLHIRVSLDEGTEQKARAENRIEVERGSGPGFTSLHYRERFALPGVKELLDAAASQSFADRVAAFHPGLTEADRAELRGVMAGLLAVIPNVYDDNDMKESDRQLLQDRSFERAVEIIERRGLAVSEETFDELRKDFPDESFDAFLQEKMPGVFLAALMTVHLEVAIPGQIADSNADRTGEGYAAWEFSLWDALEQPRELWVRSKMPE